MKLYDKDANKIVAGFQHIRRDRLERIAITSASGDVEQRIVDKYRELFGDES